MSEEPITAEEKDYQDDLIKRIKEIDQRLASFQQTTGGSSESKQYK